MKENVLICLILLSIISCTKEKKEIYIGSIDNKVNGKIEISKKNNDVKGIFINLDNNSEIQLKGTIIANKLTLQEYTENNLISGFFEGKIIDNAKYVGNWLNTNKTIKKPFSFKLETTDYDAKETNNDDIKSLKLDKDKVNIGIEKRNIFLYKILEEVSLSLKKEKNKLSTIENDNYYSRVNKEKKILKSEKKIKALNTVLSEIRKKIANKQTGKYYPFQKKPESIIDYFFTSFQKKKFEKFENILDPYGEYNKTIQMLTLMPIISNNLVLKEKTPDFENIKFNIVNIRINNTTAYVLVDVEKKYEKNEVLFTLINRNKIWYLKDISN